MKRSILLLGIILAMTVSIFASTVSAAEADLPETCPHCETAVTWEPLDATVADANEIPQGHYYLAFDADALEWTAKSIPGEVCLYMNGKTIQGSENRAFSVSGELSLIGEGSVLGRGFTGAESNGGAITVTGTLNIHGATVSVTGESGRTAANGGVVYVSGGILNMDNGAIIGGAATNGGAVYVGGANSQFNLFGGSVSGGTVTKNGGTVYLDNDCDMQMSGGTITGGNATNVGGALYTNTDSRLDMSGGSLKSGKADVGNCVYARGYVTLSQSASISQLRFAALDPGRFTVKGTYTGTTVLSYTNDPLLYLVDGDILGISEGADISGAKLSLYNRGIYVDVSGNNIIASFAKPAGTKNAYCDYCQKVVKWVGLTESDKAAGDMETGHYFLDFEGDSCEFGTKNVKSYNRICLDLNGKHLEATDRAFRVYSGVLNIMDSVGGGLITGRGTTSTTSGGTFLVEEVATLNLYSGSLSYTDVPDDGRGVVYYGGVVYVRGGQFNMYGGKVYNGAAKYGANVYVVPYTASGTVYYGEFNIFGGEVGSYVPCSSGASTKGLCVSGTSYITLSGDAKVAELYLIEDDGPGFDEMLTIQGEFTGEVVLRFSKYAAVRAIGKGENADFSEANISVHNYPELNLTTYGSALILTTGSPYLILDDGAVTGAYDTLQGAIDAYSAGKIVLMADLAVSEVINVNKDIYLDLNGFDINGTITGDYTLYCMDSKTDDYTVVDGDYGKIAVSAGGNVAAVPVEAECAEDGYLMIQEDGALSFHRINLRIKSVSLRPSQAGLYYNCDFAGDEMVQEKVVSFGVALNTKEAPAAENMETTSLYTSFAKDTFNSGTSSTSTLLANVMNLLNTDAVNARNASMKVYGRAYLLVGDEYLYGQTATCSLRQMIEAVNAKWSQLTATQKSGMLELYRDYIDVMDTWSVSAIKSPYDQIQTMESIDYTPYLTPWTVNVVDKAIEDGNIHYYFMAGEGLTCSTGTYKDKWGDSCLIVFPNGETMLIDTGYRAFGPLLTRNLHQMGVSKLDYLVITHPHSDHQGGAFYEASVLNENGILNQFEIGQVFYRGGYDPDSTGATMVLQACNDLEIPVGVLEKGDTLDIGEVHMEVLWPLVGEGDTMVSSGLEINDKSIVMRFDYGEHSSLFTGDLYTTGEDALMANTDAEILDVDLLKVPHHGYSTSSLPAFLKTVSPELAVATGRIPIKTKILGYYSDAGIELLSDWLNGYIHVSANADGTMTEEHTRNNSPDDFDYSGSGDDVVDEEE